MSGTSAAALEPVQKVKSAASGAPSISVAGHEIGYPHGHLGHLSDAEEESLRGFKEYLQEKGLYQAGPPPSHDDQTLLRFLRARRWVIPDAYKQFSDTEEWRKANDLDNLYDTIDLEAYEQARQLYPQWTGRRDRRGIPLYLFEIRHLDSKTVSAYEKHAEKTFKDAKTDGSTPSKLLSLFALYENLTRFAQPMCTELPDRDHAHVPITLSTNIVDVTGVSLRQFWNLKSHMQAASTLATAHYPETLDRIFIIGAPYFFSTVWGWIKRWFDPITVSKIFILSASEVKPTLESFIDPQNIPKQYGGELDFKWGDAPTLDPTIAERATFEAGYKNLPTGPLVWHPVNDGKDLECVAVGSEKGAKRNVRICTIPKIFCMPVSTPAAAAEEKKEEVAPVAGATEDAPVSPNGVSKEEEPADTVPTAEVQNLSISEGKGAANDISEKVLETESKTTSATVVA
ncbi:CRAL-TRIO domain-containing protein [Immersiella caudata]|uniref:CRAL-TRIO domain-containing protein n=1 Tax=Immersiella caudata TaxID=314043 RepID=A0AA39WRM3_9PEZI|nr:CRAL-TRIO domain-containing protein [Immersiella caudata]